ncbi:MAG: YqaA family protein [Spirochaetota bacterium]
MVKSTDRELSVLLKKTFLVAGLAFLVYGTLAFLLRDNLQYSGVWLKDHFGLVGVGIYCFLVDMLIVPTTIDIIFPITLQWQPVPLLAVMSAASMAGGFAGYTIARELNHITYIQRVADRYQARGKRLIERYGGWAVVIAGFTPLPFSTICWIAGLLNVPRGIMLLAVTSRIPRIILYYFLVQGGVEVLELVPW